MLSFSKRVIFVCAMALALNVILIGQELQGIASLSTEDLAGGIAMDHGELFRSELSLGASWKLQGDGFPLGATLRFRESLDLKRIHIEPAIVTELQLFQPDDKMTALPAIGVDLGVPFRLFQQELLFYLGYRYGYSYAAEEHSGQAMDVKRIDRINVMPIQAGIIWRGPGS